MIAEEVKNDRIVSEDSLLTEMRNSREFANAAFISFYENCIAYPKHIFCFYEGEDGKYYDQRIKKILGNEIITIKSGNKENTLSVWRKIKNNPAYNSIRKMFFVDKDMDELPEDKDDDLYVTPCYSIENLYVCKESFADIIETEFSISKIENDHNKCMALFRNLYSEFCDEMIESNALILIIKEKNRSIKRHIYPK